MVTQIEFYSKEAKKKLCQDKLKKQTAPEEPSEEDKDMLLSSLKKRNGSAICLSTFKNHAEEFFWKKTAVRDEGFPPPLREMIKMCKSENYLSDLTLSLDQIEALEQATIKQSETVLWHEQRIGRVTASKAHQVIHTSINNPARSLIKEICSPSQVPLNIPAVMWGKKHESHALALYKKIIAHHEIEEHALLPQGNILIVDKINKCHKNLVVKNAGLRISLEEPWVGASPDGHVFCDCCGQGVVEVKCPLKLANMPLDEYLNGKGSHLDSDGNVKKNHPYFTQVQLQMHVCKVNYCHFITWSPTDCAISFVERDQLFIDMMMAKIKLFWSSCILPILIKDESEENHVSDNFIYCKCQSDKPNEEMVGCDNESCRFQWFHFSCVGLKTKPRKKTWYCSIKCRNAHKIK